jgi:pimeloyl-ACP methyl ester carboxylesterase
MSLKEGTLRVRGAEIAYLEQGAGPLLLCLHGFPDHPRSFRHQLEAFSTTGYRVVAPYLRGYTPGSIVPGQSYQPAAVAEDARALMDALGYERAVVYGHDWGSAAAFALALGHPDRVEALVAGSVPYGPGMVRALITNPKQQRRSWYVFYFQTPLAEVAVPAQDFAFIDALWHDWSPTAQIDAEELRLVKQTLAAPGVLEAALGYYRTAMNPALRDPAFESVEGRMGVDPISVPTLYVHGSVDGCVGVEVSEGMEPCFTGKFRRVVIDGAGHFVHWEKPAEFNRAVVEFLSNG